MSKTACAGSEADCVSKNGMLFSAKQRAQQAADNFLPCAAAQAAGDAYRELRRLLDAENVRVRMDGMPRIEYTLDGEEQRLALPFLTADM